MFPNVVFQFLVLSMLGMIISLLVAILKKLYTR